MGTAGRRGETWFASMYAAHYPDIVRYGMRRLADLEGSTDLAQEVFIIAWRRRTEVPDACLPWLYGVARKVLANQRRAEEIRPATVPMVDVETLPHGSEQLRPESAVVGVDVRAAMATLSGLDQEILSLVGWEQLSLKKAAVVLGCTSTTAAVRLHRARRRLAAAMSKATSPSTVVPGPIPARL